MAKRTLTVTVIFVPLALSWTPRPVVGQLAGAQVGVGAPLGSFARPPQVEPVAQGAQPGYWIQVFYLYPVRSLHLRSAATFASFGEEEKAFTSVGTVAGFRHDLLSFVLGLETDPFSGGTVRPFVHGGAGLYAYTGRAVDVGRERPEEGIARQEFRFKWQVRLGVELGGGVIVQLVPELAQARVVVCYTSVLSGNLRGFVGYEAGAQLFEYPYPYLGKRLEYLSIGVGVVFQTQ